MWRLEQSERGRGFRGKGFGRGGVRKEEWGEGVREFKNSPMEWKGVQQGQKGGVLALIRGGFREVAKEKE